MSLTLEHVAMWDTLDGRTGKVTHACFTGAMFVPGRSLLLPAVEWAKMGRPERVTITVAPAEAEP